MNWKLAGALVLLLTIAGIGRGGWWWLSRHGTPEHFVCRAEAFVEKGNVDGALREYQRALWIAKSDRAKVATMLAMAEVAMTPQEVPLRDALSRVSTAMNVWRSILVIEPGHPVAAELLLRNSLEAARIHGTAAPWEQEPLAT